VVDTRRLPDLTQRELLIVLAGLDELPGKLSRVLYDKIVGYVNDQVEDEKRARKAVAETHQVHVEFASPSCPPADTRVLANVDRGEGAEGEASRPACSFWFDDESNVGRSSDPAALSRAD
jgi:hypothetical protein